MAKLNAHEILDLINNPEVEFIRIRLYQEASINELIKAAHLSSDSHEREILFYVLGQRRAKSAVALITAGLTDQSPKVRSLAADVLSGIGKPSVVGPVLYDTFLSETDPEAKSGLIYALGYAKYRDAIPTLIEVLKDQDEYLSAAAKWSLFHIGSQDVINALRFALEKDADEQTKTHIQKFLEGISNQKE